MLPKFSKVALGALAVSAACFALPATAQTGFELSFDGSVFNCMDTGQNGPVSFTVSASGQASGTDTVFVLDFGGSFNPISVPIPTDSLQAIVDAVSSAGGSLTVDIGPEPLGPPGCDVQGHLKITVTGGSPGTLSASAPGSVATTLSTLVTGTRSDLAGIGSRIKGVFSGRGTGVLTSSNALMVTGMAAGNGEAPGFGAWAGYSYTDTRNDFATTAFDSTRHGMLFGIDALYGDSLLVGVALGLDRSEVRTRFNAGEQGVTGMTVAPYVGLLLNDWLTLDATLGYGDSQTDQFRTAGGARISSDVESSRMFGSVNATATRAFDQVLVSGRTGLLYATQSDDSFIESNGTVIPKQRTNLGRFLIGGELAYSAGAWEPYVSGMYEHDFTSTSVAFAPGVAQPGRDDSDVLFSVGLRYFGNDNLSGYVEYSKLLGRRHLDEDTVSANVRWKF